MSTSPSVAFSETLRPDLAETLVQFDLDANRNGLVGQRIAPIIEVDVPLGQYGVIETKELLKDHDTRRQGDGSYKRGDGKGKKDSFATEEHGFEEAVDEREAIVFGGWWDAEALATERTRDVVLRNYDKRIVDMVTDTTLVANGAKGGAVWSDPAAVPITDIKTVRIARRLVTGFAPNALALDWEAFEHLRDCPQIIDRLKYAGFDNPNRDNINESVLAQALGLDEVIVASAVRNTANEGQDVSLAAQWPRTKALLFTKSTSRNTMRPRFANTFHWGGDGSTVGATFESYYSVERRRHIVRHRFETDEKLTYAGLGYIITGVLT